MTTTSKFKKIIEVLEAAGRDEQMYAEHDILMFSPPGEIDPESELGQKLTEAGANYDDDTHGWYVFT